MTEKNLNEDVVEDIEKGSETEPVSEVSPNAELEQAMKKADEYKDLVQRVQAEFDNYRKRNNEAVKVARNDATDDVITKLLPVLDNFERGMSAVEDSARQGMELIYKQIVGILEKYEVKEIEALGAEFNPEYHHAIAKCEDGEKENVIVEVFQKGYIRKNKVLRPAMVKVAQ